MATERESWEPPSLEVVGTFEELTRVTYDPNRDPRFGDTEGYNPERIGVS